MLTQLQQDLRLAASRGRSTVDVGPFLVTVTETTDHPYLSYAIPRDGAEPSPADVVALVATFRARRRLPRVEYLEEAAPAVLGALEEAGFALERRVPAMTAGAAREVPLAPGYALFDPTEDEQLAALLVVQNAAFGEPGPVSAEHLARTRETIASGGHVIAARTADGHVVGGGLATPAVGSGFAEIAGIAVAPEHRRRGLAAALTAALTRRALAGGVGAAFMTPADEGVARAYERAGFARVAWMLHARLE